MNYKFRLLCLNVVSSLLIFLIFFEMVCLCPVFDCAFTGTQIHPTTKSIFLGNLIIFAFLLYYLIRLRTREIIVYEDRIVAVIWWFETTMFFKDIKKIIRHNPSGIPSYYFISDKATINVHALMFDGTEMYRRALKFIIKSCPQIKKFSKWSKSQEIHILAFRFLKFNFPPLLAIIIFIILCAHDVI